jgi:hypothetical protein
MTRHPAAEAKDDTITELARPEGPPLDAHHKRGWRDTLLPKPISGGLRVEDMEVGPEERSATSCLTTVP